MGEFANGLGSNVFSIGVSSLVIAVNTYFVMDYVVGLGITNGFLIALFVLYGVFYLTFCAYLTLDMILNMGGSNLVFSRAPYLAKFFSADYAYTLPDDDLAELTD